MNTKQVRWSFALARADGELDFITNDGPMPAARIRELVGGDFDIVPLMDGTAIAVRRDPAGLKPNPHYKGIPNGDVLVGKLQGNDFVGAVGVPIG